MKNANGNTFDPPSVLLPFIFKAGIHVSTANELANAKQSPYHNSNEWSHSDYASPPYLNISRVLAGLLQDHRATSTVTTTSKKEEEMESFLSSRTR